MMTQEEKQARREPRRQARLSAKQAARIEAERSQRPVRELTISIEWLKSRMWGSNPHATAQVAYRGEDSPRFERREGYTCSGCGYDKESQVISEVFNDFLKYKLWKIPLDSEKIPYGIRVSLHTDENRYYEGGVGTSCYTAISAFIGGRFDHVASGNTFDVYKYSEEA